MTKIYQYEERQFFAGNKKLPQWGASPDISGYSPIDELGDLVIMNLYNRRFDYGGFANRVDEFGNSTYSESSYTGVVVNISSSIPNLGGDDFTIDFTFYHNDTYDDAETKDLAFVNILSLFGTLSNIAMKNNAYGFGWFSKGPIYFLLYDKENNYNPLVIESWNLGYNAITIGRRGSDFYIYHNGNLIQHVVDNEFGEMLDFASTGYILREPTISTFGTNFYGLRITKGFCRVDGSPKSYTLKNGWVWPSAPPASFYSENAIVPSVVNQVCSGIEFNIPASSGNFNYDLFRSGDALYDTSMTGLLRFDRLNNCVVEIASFSKNKVYKKNEVHAIGTIEDQSYGQSVYYEFSADRSSLSMFLVKRIPDNYAGGTYQIFSVDPDYSAIEYGDTRTFFDVEYDGTNLKVIVKMRYLSSDSTIATHIRSASLYAGDVLSIYARYSGSTLYIVLNNEEFSFSISSVLIQRVDVFFDMCFLADVNISYNYATCLSNYQYIYGRFNLGV